MGCLGTQNRRQKRKQEKRKEEKEEGGKEREREQTNERKGVHARKDTRRDEVRAGVAGGQGQQAGRRVEDPSSLTILAPLIRPGPGQLAGPTLDPEAASPPPPQTLGLSGTLGPQAGALRARGAREPSLGWEGLEPGPWPARAAPHGHTGQQQTDRWTDGWTGMEGLGVGGLEAGSQRGSPDPRGNVLRATGRGRKWQDHPHLGGPILTVLRPVLCFISET